MRGKEYCTIEWNVVHEVDHKLEVHFSGSTMSLYDLCVADFSAATS